MLVGAFNSVTLIVETNLSVFLIGRYASHESLNCTKSLQTSGEVFFLWGKSSVVCVVCTRKQVPIKFSTKQRHRSCVERIWTIAYIFMFLPWGHRVYTIKVKKKRKKKEPFVSQRLTIALHDRAEFICFSWQRDWLYL